MSTTATRVLFVDDHPDALADLQRALRPQSDSWNMEFAVGGVSALATLQQQRFDVVVTEMAMADVDGAELLRWVRVNQPSTARIVLSTHSASGSVHRSLAVAHQFLAKPCQPETLTATVERVSAVLSRISDLNVTAAIGGLERLPSPSASVLALGRLFEEDPVDIDQVGAVISGDIAMTTKILQLVNSAFFGLPRTITDPREAISYLGLSALRDAAISAALFQAFQDMPAVTRFAEQAQMIGTCRADMAFSLARIAGHKVLVSRDIWLAAFLADIGAVALVATHPERADAVLDQIDTATAIADSAASEVISAVGAHLLSLWGLPHHLVEAVAMSCDPPASSKSLGAGFSWLANRLMLTDPAAEEAIDDEQLGALGLRAEMLPVRA